MTAAPTTASFVDPVRFQSIWLNRHLWHKQREILHSVLNHSLTAVKGCHASGKTWAAAGMVPWWLVRYKTGKVFTTAPTLRQVKTHWKDIVSARQGSKLLMQLLPDPTVTGIDLGPERYATGASSSTGVNLQGLHGSDVLIIADEAPGIEVDIWDSIEGIRAGGNVRLLIQGNPTIPSGYFFDAFHRGRNLWNCITISAFDTPNLQHETEPRPLTIEELVAMGPERLAWTPFPSLITRAWVRERWQVWGPNHPKYLSRVLGQFPTQADNAVYSLQWIENAKRDPTEKELIEAKRHPIQVGIDVAGAGSDETVLCARVNGMILEMHAWQDADPLVKVMRVLSRLKHHPLYRLGSIVVDIVGIGYNFALRLADHGFTEHIFGHISGARANDTGVYANQKAEAAFQLREWLKGGFVSGLGLLTTDEELTVTEEETEAQLATMLYRETGRGITEIIGKEEMMKKHNVPSPDRAEALIMAFLRCVPQHQTATHREDYVISEI